MDAERPLVPAVTALRTDALTVRVVEGAADFSVRGSTARSCSDLRFGAGSGTFAVSLVG